MKIINCKYIYNNEKIINNGAIAFNNRIIDIDSSKDIIKKYPNAKIYNYSQNCVLYPGFINPHVHLEFSSNEATLEYNGFLNWLYSVIENRDTLVNSLDENIINKKINEMLYSGVTTFGAISSFGADLNSCITAKQRVIYFNEVIGSNPAMVDALFTDFKMRLNESKAHKSDKFYPAVAIHSPYSVHHILIKEVLNIAKTQNLPTTTHFLESQAEREWLQESKGEFKEFFEKFFKISKPVNSIEEFLTLFNNKPTLFTHCTQATNKEFDILNKQNHTVIHCPRSNRLLGCGKLDIFKAKNLTLGTDGLSSNYSLSILEEMKIALFMHEAKNIKELAKNLIKAVTITPAKALNMSIGELKKNNFADFAIFNLPSDLNYEDSGSIALHTIINNTKAEDIFINGEKI